MNKTKIESGKGYWTDDSFRFNRTISFDIESEIDVVIVMSCDKNWADLVAQKPLIAPQSHLVKARTDQNYDYMHNNWTINSEKYVFKYISNIKIINQSNETEGKTNFYSVKLQSKFRTCNPHRKKENFGEKNLLTFKYDDLINNFQENNSFSLNGSISIFGVFDEVLTSNLTAFIFQYGDISECLWESLGKNLNDNQFDNEYVYFNDSFQNPFFFILNSTNEIDFSLEKTVKNITNFIDLIGKSIIFRSFSVNTYTNIDSISYYMSYITFSQNFQCENQAESCLGIALKDNGVCFLINEDQNYDSYLNFIVKLIIYKPLSAYQTNVKLEAILNLRYLKSKFNGFTSLNIKNEENEVNISINSNTERNFLKTEIFEFPLLYDKALGNKFAINIISENKRITIGICDIVHVNSSFNTFEYLTNLNSLYPFVKPEDSLEKVYEYSLGIILPILLIILICISNIFLFFFDI